MLTRRVRIDALCSAEAKEKLRELSREYGLSMGQVIEKLVSDAYGHEQMRDVDVRELQRQLDNVVCYLMAEHGYEPLLGEDQ